MTRLLCDEAALPGLLWAMRFASDGTGRLVESEEVLPEPGGFGEGFLWLHFNLADARVATFVEAGHFGPSRLVASAFDGDPHQRVAWEGAFVGGVVADLVHGAPIPGRAAAEGRLHFVMGPRLLVSGRHHPITGPDALQEAALAGDRLAGPVHLLERLVDRVADAIAQTGSRLSDDLDGIEDRLLDGRPHGDGRRLGPIRRDAVRLHRQLLGLRAVFHRLDADGEAKQLSESGLQSVARLAQRLDALDRDMALLAERSRLMQEERASELATQANRQLYTLSILTALFLPPTLVTGLFGMNTKGLPLSEYEEGSTLAILAAALAALAVYALLRTLGIRAPRD